MKSSITLLLFFIYFTPSQATDYHVGPSQTLTSIAQAPWATLQPGDRVYIHWRNTPYKEKWVINRQGTEANRIEIIGVNGPNGEQPIIDGNGAVTPTNLNYWNEDRSVIKIGGSSVPADGLPSYITIENLEIKSGYVDYQYTDDNGNMGSYSNNAAAIHVEKATHLIIRNCTIHDSGNGIFIGAFNGGTQDILIEKNHIFGNGVVNRFYEHNTYTEAIDITYQYNHFGPLRTGADGNNLKDRSAGLVVRYNWIEGGNRQLDLVDAEGSQNLVNHPRYHTTHVYGNILIEPDGAGNSQIIHYGGDSGTTADYRKGDLYLYNNTIISTRTGNTTLVRLSTGDETAHVFNNVIHTTANGNKFAMIDDNGTFNMHHNWLKTGWVNCHCSPSGSINDMGNNLTGADPLFEDFANQEFRPLAASPLVDNGDIITAVLLPDYDVTEEYVKHQDQVMRAIAGNFDIGAYEYSAPLAVDYHSPFQAVAFANHILLSWETAHEKELDQFVIQRSIDGLNWEDLIFTPKQTKAFYQQYDTAPLTGYSYYRLQQFDTNGNFQYSNIEAIEWHKIWSEIKISPNPASTEILFQLPKAQVLESFDIFDPAGHLLIKNQKNNQSNIHLDVSQWKNGLHLIRILDSNGNIHWGRFLVQKN